MEALVHLVGVAVFGLLKLESRALTDAASSRGGELKRPRLEKLFKLFFASSELRTSSSLFLIEEV